MSHLCLSPATTGVKGTSAGWRAPLSLETGPCPGKGCLRCVGACGLAPVVMIGEHVYGRLDVKDVRKILDDIAAQD